MAVKTPAPETYADKLDAIIARASALRHAGVLSVGGGDISFTLAPPDPPPPRGPKEEPEPDLDDVVAFTKGRAGATP